MTQDELGRQTLDGFLAQRRLVHEVEEEWRLRIRDTSRDLSARKAVKLHLPIRHHIKLHVLRVFGGSSVSDMVVEALDDFFGKKAREDHPDPATRAHDPSP